MQKHYCANQACQVFCLEWWLRLFRDYLMYGTLFNGCEWSRSLQTISCSWKSNFTRSLIFKMNIALRLIIHPVCTHRVFTCTCSKWNWGLGEGRLWEKDYGKGMGWNWSDNLPTPSLQAKWEHLMDIIHLVYLHKMQKLQTLNYIISYFQCISESNILNDGQMSHKLIIHLIWF